MDSSSLTLAQLDKLLQHRRPGDEQLATDDRPR